MSLTFRVADLERSAAFYGQVLGLDEKYRFPTYAGFECGGVEIGLIPGREKPADPEGPCVDFLVRDVDEAYRALRDRGVRFLEEPHDTPWGSRIAVFTDPDGHLLQLLQIDWGQYFAACVPR